MPHSPKMIATPELQKRPLAEISQVLSDYGVDRTAILRLHDEIVQAGRERKSAFETEVSSQSRYS